MRISRSTLAAMLGVTTATIYNWETDRFSPNSNYLPKLAAALQKPEDYFYA
jgi:transcriptional regulator with XRE-family HTH domain